MSVGVFRVKPTYYANIQRPEEFDTGLKIRVLDEARQRLPPLRSSHRRFRLSIFRAHERKEQPSYGLH